MLHLDQGCLYSPHTTDPLYIAHYRPIVLSGLNFLFSIFQLTYSSSFLTNYVYIGIGCLAFPLHIFCRSNYIVFTVFLSWVISSPIREVNFTLRIFGVSLVKR